MMARLQIQNTIPALLQLLPAPPEGHKGTTEGQTNGTLWQRLTYVSLKLKPTREEEIKSLSFYMFSLSEMKWNSLFLTPFSNMYIDINVSQFLINKVFGRGYVTKIIKSKRVKASKTQMNKVYCYISSFFKHMRSKHCLWKGYTFSIYTFHIDIYFLLMILCFSSYLLLRRC